MIITSVVTTSHRAGPEQITLARKFSEELGVPLVPRENLSLSALINKYQVKGAVVVTLDKVYFYMNEQEFFFHPNMSVVRIKDIKSGKTDQMIKAMDLKPGNSVLDCTLGFGADAIVASYIAGETGSILGLEASPIIAVLVRYGLENYPIKCKLLSLCMKNISVINTHHYDYLRRAREDSFDIIYFDPMFRQPKLKSTNLAPLRMLANPEPLTIETLKEAVRVARKRVVVKERRNSTEFKRLGINRIEGGKYAPIVYGVVDKQGGVKY
ncbi:class I SAM-dependent methyltransferase [Desulfolucanica intricata]|uniref:class I SAM-dependent methyltransferase n=1 Tax=Desulfolucanica intricata TaxID=1285191 RepID=UPI00082A9171|nr:class I SAM-dependent methyltransferase [Desulfolucanica intricata]